MIDAMQFEFMRNALAAGLLASIICGVIGSLVVVNRIVFLAGGIAHAAYGGIGLSAFMGWPFLPGTMGFSLVSAAAMAGATLNARHRADTVIGVVWATGMATGVILLDLTPGYQVDLMSYLFGSILTVPRADLAIMLILVAIILAGVGYHYNDWLAMSYDDEFARVRGVPVTRLYMMLICLIAVSVVMLIQVVGLILVIALLTIPPYIAERYAPTLAHMMAMAVALGVVFTVSGLWLAYAFNLTSGASIIIVAALGFFLSSLTDRLRKAQYRKAAPTA